MKVKVVLAQRKTRQSSWGGHVEFAQVCLPSKLNNCNPIFLKVDLHCTFIRYRRPTLCRHQEGNFDMDDKR